MFNFKTKKTEIASSSDYLNGLVVAYREGLPNSAEVLLDAFSPITNKYFNLLVKGFLDPRDDDTKKFLSMISKCSWEKAANNLSVSISKIMEPVDVKQELVLALLRTANRYINISANFKYVLKERVSELLIDRGIVDNTISDTYLDDSYEFLELGAIDKSWVRGITTGAGWDQLTPLQRAIIKYIYHDGLAESAAAKTLKMSVSQLRSQNKAAKTLLSDYFDR